MLFSSILFLFFFLPAVLLGHTLLPPRLRNGFLLAASIAFYALGDPRYLPLILAMTGINYLLGRAIGACSARLARRLTALAAVAVNVGVLGYYKYAGLIFPNWSGVPALPLGISFYSFQSLSYLLDVCAGRVEAERSPFDYATYILLFPQLIAGPIVRYSDVERELHGRRVASQGLERGMTAFLIGLASKVLLANRVGALYARLDAIPSRGTLASAVMLAACALQYYYDFAGYSLMAIGIGRMLGFEFPQNFRHPFASRSIGEFWRRWHITLGDWLRTYLYIPLGGSQRGRARLLLNLLITWAVSGLWHGAGFNFLAWGLYFGALIALERLCIGDWLAAHPRAARAYTLTAVWLSWMLFSCETVGELSAFAAQLLSPALGRGVLFALASHVPVLLLAALFCSPHVCKACERAFLRRDGVRVAVLTLLFALCVMELLRSQYNPFLYFRF